MASPSPLRSWYCLAMLRCACLGLCWALAGLTTACGNTARHFGAAAGGSGGAAGAAGTGGIGGGQGGSAQTAGTGSGRGGSSGGDGVATAGAGGLGAAGGAGATGTGPVLDGACTQNGALACNGSAQKLQLLCESGSWHANGTCKATENCDQTSGACAAILSECDGQMGGGLVCGSGDTLERCGPDLISVETIEACTGKCVPQAMSADCAPSTCGDGKVQAPEECDDGNTVNSDACTNACKNATCGDGATWAAHEACDDGNSVNTDACVACKLATCGDGFVQTGIEQCDLNDPASADQCSRSCYNTTWALWPMPNPASLPGLPHPASYDTATAGVVTDKVTGLMWQRAVDPGTYTWADAKTYCANLALASFSDWRLPTRIELASLVDFTIAAPGPTIDVIAFPSTPQSTFWTASLVAGASVPGAYIADFGHGWAADLSAATAALRVRCVR